MFKSILQSSVYVLFSNFLRLVSKFLAGIVSAKLLGPTNYGFFSLIDLVNKYGPISNLGVSSGISREIPMNLGRDDEKYASKLNDVGFTGLLISTGLTAFLIVTFSLVFLRGLPLFAVIMAALGIIVNAVYEYHIMFSYSHSRFRAASSIITFYSIALLFLTVILVWRFNIWGQLISIFLVPLVTISFVYIKKKHLFSIRFDSHVYLQIVKVGLPLILIGMGYTFLITVDRLLIVRFYDMTTLGYYGLAIMAFVFSQQVPDAISQVIYPKLNLVFGQSSRIDKLDKVSILPSILLSIAMPLLIGTFIYILPFIVKAFLPAYVNGIVPAELIIIPIAIYGINILNTLFKIKILIIVLLCSIIGKVLCAYLFYKMGLGLDGIALASSLAILGYTVSITIISLLLMDKSMRYNSELLLFLLIVAAGDRDSMFSFFQWLCTE